MDALFFPKKTQNTDVVYSNFLKLESLFTAFTETRQNKKNILVPYIAFYAITHNLVALDILTLGFDPNKKIIGVNLEAWSKPRTEKRASEPKSALVWLV